MIAMSNASWRHSLFVNKYFVRRAKSFMAKGHHVSKRDVDNQFSDIFNSNQALMPEGADLNCLRNEACYLMVKIHQKYLSL